MYRTTLSGIIIFFWIFFSACQNGSEIEVYSNGSDYLISYEKIDSTVSVQQLLKLFPELYNVLEYDLEIIRIVYRSNKKSNLSGLILLPKTSEPLPLLSYQRKAVYSNSETPSLLGTGIEIAPYLSSKGAIVLLPDFYGFGESCCQLSPRAIKHSVIDDIEGMIMAAIQLLNCEGIVFKNQLCLAGYSWGGYSTAAFIEKHRYGYYGDLKIVSASVGSVPFLLEKTMLEHFSISNADVEIETLPIAYQLASYNDYYGLKRTDIFRMPYQSKIDEGLFINGLSEEELKNELPDRIDELLSETFIEGLITGSEPEIVTLLKENNIGAWDLKHDLWIIHGQNDRKVPVFNAIGFTRNMAMTDKLRFIEIPEADHLSALDLWAGYTLYYAMN